MPQSDIEFRLSFTGGGQGRLIDPAVFSRIPEIIMEEIAIQMNKVADELEMVIRRNYEYAFRESKVESKRHVRDAIYASINSSVRNQLGEMSANIFDVDHARTMTEYTTNTGRSGNVFDLLEDGVEMVRDDGSSAYGFISLNQALHVAENWIASSQMADGAAAEFIDYVKEHFSGMSGEGIMVKLADPLFYKYPAIGDADDFVSPHPGSEGTNVLSSIDLTQLRSIPITGAGLAHDLVSKAMQEAKGRIANLAR